MSFKTAYTLPLPEPFNNHVYRNTWGNVNVKLCWQKKEERIRIEQNGPFFYFLVEKPIEQIIHMVFSPNFVLQDNDPKNSKNLVLMSLFEPGMLNEIKFSSLDNKRQFQNMYFETMLQFHEFIETINVFNCQMNDTTAALLPKSKMIVRSQCVLQRTNNKFWFQSHIQNESGAFTDGISHEISSTSAIYVPSIVPPEFGSQKLISQVFMLKEMSSKKEPLMATFLCKSIESNLKWILNLYTVVYLSNRQTFKAQKATLPEPIVEVSPVAQVMIETLVETIIPEKKPANDNPTPRAGASNRRKASRALSVREIKGSLTLPSDKSAIQPNIEEVFDIDQYIKECESWVSQIDLPEPLPPLSIRRIMLDTNTIDNERLLENLISLDMGENNNNFWNLPEYNEFSLEKLCHYYDSKYKMFENVDIKEFLPFDTFPSFDRTLLEYPSPPASAFDSEIISLSEEIINLSQITISTSPLTDRLCFFVACIFLNGLKCLNDSEDFSHVLKSLENSMPFISQIVQDCLKEEGLMSQVSIFSQMLIQTKYLIPVLTNICFYEEWLNENYFPCSVFFNNNINDTIIPMLNKIMKARAFDLVFRKDLTKFVSSEDKEKLVSIPESPASMIEEIIRKASKISEVESEISEFIATQIEVGLKKKGIALLSNAWSFIAEIIKYAPSSPDNEWKEFVASINAYRTRIGAIVGQHSVVSQWILDGIKAKKLHIWIFYLVVQRGIVEERFYPHSVLFDFHRANRLIRSLCVLSKMY